MDVATALPLELPIGSCWGIYAPNTWPPVALQPFVLLKDRRFAQDDSAGGPQLGGYAGIARDFSA